MDIKSLNDSVFYIVARTKSDDGDISNNPWPGPLGNYWILQVNRAGEIIWEKVHGGSDEERIRDFIISNDGGIITLGLSKSTDGDIDDHAGWYDLWMVKLNKNGNKEWAMSLGGIGLEEGGFVRQTSDGGYIVGGCTDGYGGGNYDTICNYHGIEGVGGGWLDAWVIKLDSSRNIEWQQTYGGKYHDCAENIIEIEDGYVICASTNSNDGDVTNFHGVAGNQEYGDDIWVIKIDKQGNIIWENCLGGLNNEFARNIFTTSDGGYMVVGRTSSDDGDVEGYHGIGTGIYDDIWLAKIDSLGNLTWQYCYGGGGRELLYRGVVQEGDFDYTITLSTDSDEWQCKSSWQPDLRVVKLTDSVVGIDENGLTENNVKIVPNPASNKITVNSSQDFNVLRIYDTYGNNIKSFNSISNKIDFNISSISQGVYIIALYKDENIIGKQKLIVK